MLMFMYIYIVQLLHICLSDLTILPSFHKFNITNKSTSCFILGSIVVSFLLTNGPNAVMQINLLMGKIENNALPMTVNGIELLVGNS